MNEIAETGTGGEVVEVYGPEEGRDDPAFITAALGNIARARGMSQLARKTGLTREGLYKALSPDGNPEFGTVMKVIRALGLELHGAAAKG